MSELMLPALGWKARLLEPPEASAVWGRIREAKMARILLSGRSKRRLRSFATLAPR